MSKSKVFSFSDFGIAPKRDHFIGEKIRIMRILNQQIVVHDFKVVESKYENSGDVMHLQLSYKDEMHVLFTASRVLINQINLVPEDKFPFSTTICKEGESFVFK